MTPLRLAGSADAIPATTTDNPDTLAWLAEADGVSVADAAAALAATRADMRERLAEAHVDRLVESDALADGLLRTALAARPGKRHVTLTACAAEARSRRLDLDPQLREAGERIGLPDAEVDEILSWAAGQAPAPLLRSNTPVPEPTAPPAAVVAAGPEWRSLFVDVGAALDAGLKTPEPDAGPERNDGKRWLYYGRVNSLVGDPETAKTLVALTVCAHGMTHEGRHAVVIDTDHNGRDFVLRFLRALGVPDDVLRSQLLYAQPESRADLLAVVTAVAQHVAPCPVVIDSVGENLALFGFGPNDDSGVLTVNTETAARLAHAGHCVLSIDHLAKNTASRAYGATGSTAKKRAADGVLIEVSKDADFDPTSGGKSTLTLKKDRAGGVRALGVKTDKPVAHFDLSAPDAAGLQTYTFRAPAAPTKSSAYLDVRALAAAALDAAGVPADSGVNAAWDAVRALPDFDTRWKPKGVQRDTVRGVQSQRKTEAEGIFG
ncbi:hypothetical protein [Cellulosimicrobium sp. 22601]|uniref:hypothetical protein n=1 Tax=unclassified Cellulosimicrobium TaxID=2624466 RepID=UPI003F84C740